MRNKGYKPTKPRIAFVVDGESETWYLQMLKKNEHLAVDLKPEIPQKKKLKDQFDRVKELAENYTFVYWIVDFDKILEETLAAKKGKITRMEELRQYCTEIKRKSKKYNNVEIIINNPCQEYWFLLHFENKAPLYSKCNDTITHLKKHLKDFEKTEKYFKKTNDDIYLKLKPNLTNAISHAKSLPAFDFTNPNNTLSEMHKIFEHELLRVCLVNDTK